MTFFGTVLGIVIVIALASWIIGYNALIKYLNWVEESWEQVEVQIKRQFDLIPELVDTAQPYMRHEQALLEKLLELRSGLDSRKQSRAELVDADEALSASLRSVFDKKQENEGLQGNKDFEKLEALFIESEAKLDKAKRVYNNTVTKYNSKIQSVPTRFVADAHNFHSRETVHIH
ncbi:LemA protein [Sinobaca qinghaiensis]|uniref:LemA protein n=1 Tax=Sinobaca qinghaiensis TaxID=342944 RepID=A0A419V3S7_9BACL|nr:LemA family protein [Sinobaca qinghaiensis]RKD73169.1 LemA protein [Sinobaca qinghaiensis]